MIKGAKNSLFYERDNTYQKGQDKHYKKQYFFFLILCHYLQSLERLA